jgi:hypothetical protein
VVRPARALCETGSSPFWSANLVRGIGIKKLKSSNSFKSLVKVFCGSRVNGTWVKRLGSRIGFEILEFNAWCGVQI